MAAMMDQRMTLVRALDLGFETGWLLEVLKAIDWALQMAAMMDHQMAYPKVAHLVVETDLLLVSWKATHLAPQIE